MNRDIVFCRILLAHLRREAKELGIKLPKRLTALPCYARTIGDCNQGFYLVEGLGGFRQEVYAHNAFDARGKAISKLIDAWCKEHPEVDTSENRSAAFKGAQKAAADL